MSAYVHSDAQDLPHPMTSYDAKYVVMKKYPRLSGHQPKVRYNVQYTPTGGSMIFLNFDVNGELLGWGKVMDNIGYAFNTAADGSIIGMTGKKGRKPNRPKLFIAIVRGEPGFHPDFDKELQAEYGKPKVRTTRKADWQKYNWRAGWGALRAGAVPNMKHLAKARGTANKRGNRVANSKGRRNSDADWQGVWHQDEWVISVNTRNNRVSVVNDYRGFVEYPVDHGYQTRQPYARQIAYDRPEVVPKYVQKVVGKVFDQINAERGTGNRATCKPVRFTRRDGTRVSFKSCK